ncbi:major facilitator superfamily domain-containing protein 6 [Parasteatoda tepidariorum]|uniref:major facilitator superfamily domain-containing protein 6 n=1 Tax=Parasteatoda tepidariorum TaxID=114398 RepID=UPI001C71898C|nr:major facilitator superfamily domain-containing protein 6 [Parasteatoda tepidariorum]XP_015923812.2 major facilitator superfamily domain-containing protein 6 [Parasteatoda tepidariorum]XP_015923814.2 major facilitator superfamily domain-containing protein 6 [Parasteatoda tepidariorum]XP_042907969.1 major facilitator superfamily domain-containing protein 6 [Parasteatoda tepidariorum]XP_042907970.1 major facilitator superfamily domain-containing protein 6 [Parasteatoda tepidariorum]XP_0429079
MTMASVFKINRQLLPIKLHFFFFYGAMGGVVPYMPVYAKELGITATAVGFIFTLIPFCVFLSKPLFGYLTDYFRNIKVIVFILVVITSASFVAILFVPSVEKPDECHRSEELSIHCNQSCKTQSNESCRVLYRKCGGAVLKMMVVFDDSDTFDINDTVSKELPCSSIKRSKSLKCNCIDNPSSTHLNCSVVYCPAEEDVSMYGKFQFWIFVLLAVVSGTGANTLYTLSDAACYEVLGERPELYGRQRLWATISWGLITLLAGFVNDVATASKGRYDYSPGFYIMIAFVVLDLVLLLKIKLAKTNFSLNIFQDVRKIFASSETVVFAVAVYFSGAFSGLLWGYEFWYLEELGATQMLLGLAAAIQCLIAEVPMFFFSGWFIATFGYFYCLAGAFAAFALRFILYFLLQNPWLVLPIELTHSFTWAVFYACMTRYASSNAPAGTETTMLGILGGIYEGLGVATGSLLGGVGFDKLGGRYTFLVAAVISFLCVPYIFISYFFLKRNSKTSS